MVNFKTMQAIKKNNWVCKIKRIKKNIFLKNKNNLLAKHYGFVNVHV